MDRFWEKVARGGPSDCWEWAGNRTRSGYGVFWHDGKNVRAHRLALTLQGFPCPYDGALAIHSCDNPPCCNPSHLRWGTHQDNVDDRSLRNPRIGENSHAAIANNETVAEIYRRRIAGETCGEIATAMGLSRHLVMNIYTGRAWAHRLGVDGNPTLDELRSSRPRRKRPAHNRVVTDEMADFIFQARMNGMKAKEVAETLGLPLGTVSPVYSGHAFTDRLGKGGNPTKAELQSVRHLPSNQTLLPDDVQEITALLRQGFTGRSIASKYGVSPARVSYIKKAAGL